MIAICLIGMSGVGKSFWGKRLVEEGFSRRDCDGAIGAHLSDLVDVQPGEEPVHALGRWMGMPWRDGYREREAQYLALEERVTQEALVRLVDRTVIDATGSVVYLSSALQAELRAKTRVVHLRTPKERYPAMLERYLAEPKPVVFGDAFAVEPGEAPEAALPRCYERLLLERSARYDALSHVSIDIRDLEGALGVDALLREAKL